MKKAQESCEFGAIVCNLWHIQIACNWICDEHLAFTSLWRLGTRYWSKAASWQPETGTKCIDATFFSRVSCQVQKKQSSTRNIINNSNVWAKAANTFPALNNTKLLETKKAQRICEPWQNNRAVSLGLKTCPNVDNGKRVAHSLLAPVPLLLVRQFDSPHY